MRGFGIHGLQNKNTEIFITLCDTIAINSGDKKNTPKTRAWKSERNNEHKSHHDSDLFTSYIHRTS